MRVVMDSQSMIRWRLRQVMAEININNQELAALSGVHRVTISKLRNADEIKQITGDVLNKLCNALNRAYRAKGREDVITPGVLMQYTPDDESVI